MEKTAPPLPRAGFTLLELLIVISIITVISAAAIPGFSGYVRTQNLKQSMEQVKSDLRTAQIRALAGSFADDENVSYWSVNFVTNRNYFEIYTYDHEENEDHEVPRGESESLVSDIVIRNADEGRILFLIPNGDAYASAGVPCSNDGSNCKIVLGPEDIGGDRCAAVWVNSAGGIFKEEGEPCV